jgi:23S rRNA (guanine745-N1)-methyltransferase
MRPEVLRHLRCPICHDRLALDDPPRGPLRCPQGHSFDQARQGYVQLSAAPLVHTGDTGAMIAARSAFLSAGHYAPITSALRVAAAAWPGDLVLDVGAGSGHHLAGVLDGLPDAYGLATDASKPAARAAVRAHPRVEAVVCDAWQPLPLAADSVGVALNVFAPRPGAEFARVLRPDGVLLVVTPTADHLGELIEPLQLLRVDPTKAERVANTLETVFTRCDVREIRAEMTLAPDDVTTLVGMGPSAWHTNPATLATKIANLPNPAHATLSVTLSTYRPHS